MCRSEELVFLKSELRWVFGKAENIRRTLAQTSLFAAADHALQSALFNSFFLLLTYGNDIGRFGDREAVAFGVRLDTVFNRGLNFAKCFRRLPCQKSAVRTPAFRSASKTNRAVGTCHSILCTLKAIDLPSNPARSSAFRNSSSFSNK